MLQYFCKLFIVRVLYVCRTWQTKAAVIRGANDIIPQNWLNLSIVIWHHFKYSLAIFFSSTEKLCLGPNLYALRDYSLNNTLQNIQSSIVEAFPGFWRCLVRTPLPNCDVEFLRLVHNFFLAHKTKPDKQRRQHQINIIPHRVQKKGHSLLDVNLTNLRVFCYDFWHKTC